MNIFKEYGDYKILFYKELEHADGLNVEFTLNELREALLGEVRRKFHTPNGENFDFGADDATGD